MSALQKVKESRSQLIEELKAIPYLTVFPSQANYIMCELGQEISSRELLCYLLQNNIFMKDLTAKIKNGKQYIRREGQRRRSGELLEKHMGKSFGR